MQLFIDKVHKHAEHVTNVGQHCATEETTKQALILPLLDILGFSPFDPTKVKAEWGADFPGAKHGERVDYSLFCQGVPVMFIEAKAYAEKLTNHCPQLARYFNATPEVTVAAITNGQEWRFFTDLNNKNIMDQAPFLTIDFKDLDDTLLTRLHQFKHDHFQPEALRTLAEESVYLSGFKQIISTSLSDPDAEFVRFVASRANIQRQLNMRFVESITPLVRLAIEQSVSDMVVSGLSAKTARTIVVSSEELEAEATPMADEVDPHNSRIVTSYAERRILEIVQEILGPEADISGKDTESYYTVLYQGKSNRWLARYMVDRKIPAMTLSITLDETRLREIARAGLQVSGNGIISLPTPEHLLRIPGLVSDAYAHCCDDANFRRAEAITE